MNKIKLFFIIILFQFNCNVQNENNKIKFIERLDNDYSPLPENLRCKNINNKVPKIIKNRVASLLEDYTDGQISLVYLIKYDENIDLYMVKMYYNDNNYTDYILIGYNKLENNILNGNYRINGTFIENNEFDFPSNLRLMNKPYISFVDIDKDGLNEILIKERVHNGNVYNAVLSHYLTITPSQIKSKITIENISYYFLDKKYICRTISNDTINSYLISNTDTSIIGRVIIKKSDIYRVVKKDILNDTFSNFLITTSPDVNEQDLLAK